MNVSCPECGSVFRVDPAKVPVAGVRARCSVCGGVITIGESGRIDDDFAGVAASSSPPASGAAALPATGSGGAGAGGLGASPRGGPGDMVVTEGIGGSGVVTVTGSPAPQPDLPLRAGGSGQGAAPAQQPATAARRAGSSAGSPGPFSPRPAVSIPTPPSADTRAHDRTDLGNST